MKIIVNKATYYYISATMLLGIGIVFVLGMSAGISKTSDNGFARNFIGVITIQHVAPKPADLSLIIGNFDKSIYFQTRQGHKIVMSDSSLRTFSNIIIKFPKPVSPFFRWFIDSNYITLFDGNGPMIYRGSFETRSVKIAQHIPYFFSRASLFNGNSFVLRAMDAVIKSKNQVFIKGRINDPSLLREKNLSERRYDGGMSSDGLIHFDKKTNSFVYVQFYQNSFIRFDTSLNLVYKSHTIDTTATYQRRVGLINSNNSKMFDNIGPSRIVNMVNVVHNGKIYNHSTLKSDNELNADFISHAVIDVYNVSDGRYAGSFYIPNYKGESMWDFKVSDNMIIVLYKNYVATYAMPSLDNK